MRIHPLKSADLRRKVEFDLSFFNNKICFDIIQQNFMTYRDLIKDSPKDNILKINLYLCRHTLAPSS